MSEPNVEHEPKARLLRFLVVRGVVNRLSTVPWRAIYNILDVANITLVAAITAAAVAAMAFALQRKEYDEQSFVRSQGSINLAWRTLDAANNHLYEAGQSAALLYLSNIGQLQGHLTLINTAIGVNTYDSDTSRFRYAFVNLKDSALCGDEIASRSGPVVMYDFSHSVLRNTTLSGNFTSSDFVAADLRNAVFTDVTMTNARFAAGMLENSVLHGGVFANSDFQGATLRGLKTERGSVGAGYVPKATYGSGGYMDGYYVLGRMDWPLLFDKNIGQEEALATLGMARTSADNYLVDFSGARFTQADLRGAHVENSNITQRQINEACADSTTILPLGVKVEEQCANTILADELRKYIRVYNLPAANAPELCKP